MAYRERAVTDVRHPPAAASADELDRNAIGFSHCLAQSVTHMAPGAAIAFALTVSIIFAGAATPLSFLLGLAGALLVAYCVVQLVRHMPSAGYYMSYVGRSMGKEMGMMAAWAIIGAEVIIPAVLYLLLAPILNQVLDQYWGFTIPWWVCVLTLAAIVTAITYLGVRLSTRVAIVLGALEFLVFLALSLTLIVHAGSHNTTQVFWVSAPGVQHGWSGIFKGMVFAMAAFLGFETAAPLAEETDDPRRNVPRAIYVATLAIGILFIIAAYAAVVGWGIHDLTSYTQNADPWHELGNRVWGIGWIVVFLAVLNSILANAMAGQNGGARVVYALGRARIFPAVFQRTHPRYRSPHVAILAMTAFNLLLALAFGWKWGDFGAFSVLVTIATLFFIGLYIFACLAVPIYYYRFHRDEFRPFFHLLIPLVGAVLFVFPIYYTVVPLPAYPIKLAPFIAIGWLVAGVAVTWILRARNPRALEAATELYVN